MIAVWAALIAVAKLLPSIPIVGTGSTFSVSAALFPLAGIFFGPVSGAVCAAIGSFLGQMLAPHTAWLGLATFLVGTINALTAGLVARGKWPLAIGIILIGSGLWFSTEIGRQAPLFPLVFYSLGIIMAILGGTIGNKWLKSDNNLLKTASIWLAAYAGFVGAAAIANYLGIMIVQIPATVWKVLVFVSPVERAIFALGSAIIGVPLILGLTKIGIMVGPQEED